MAPRPNLNAGRATRREALAIGIGALAGGVAGGAHRARAGAGTAIRLRPPGAGGPDGAQRFESACIRCAQCVQACPYDTLHLAGLRVGLATGLPTFDPVQVPCRLCEGHATLRCIESCPTDALLPVGERDVDIGEAVIDETRCLAFNDTMCRACWHACPFPNEAIRLDGRLRPVVETVDCVGCGMCVRACPTDPPSILVEPQAAGGAA